MAAWGEICARTRGVWVRRPYAYYRIGGAPIWAEMRLLSQPGRERDIKYATNSFSVASLG